MNRLVISMLSISHDPNTVAKTYFIKAYRSLILSFSLAYTVYTILILDYLTKFQIKINAHKIIYTLKNIRTIVCELHQLNSFTHDIGADEAHIGQETKKKN